MSGNTQAQEPLDALVERIRACRICRDAPEHGAPLPHEPRPVLQVHGDARLLIVGQAPGTRVHASGRPFTDPSGERLRDWLGINADLFYDASRVAIVPMGFCFPGLDAKGGDLPPRKECAPRWRQAVLDRLPHVELVLVIGQYAQAWHLGPARGKSLTETVRNWPDYLTSNRTPKVLPLPHPAWRNNAWIKKNPWFNKDLIPVLRAEIERLMAG